MEPTGMKANLIIYPHQTLEGYVSIDFNQINNLGFYFDDGDCSEFILNDSLDYLSQTNRWEILKSICSKVAPGGTIKLFGLEPNSLFKSYYAQRIDLRTFNHILFGAQHTLFDSKKSLSGMGQTQDFLKSLGYVIESANFDDVNYFISARRT